MHVQNLNPYPLGLYGFAPNGGKTQKLSLKTAKGLKIKLQPTSFKEFSDGAFIYYPSETIRDYDTYFIIQPRFGNELQLSSDIMRCFSFIDALKQASPYRITVVMPCLPNARQDRPSNYREPELVKQIPKALHAFGADRLVVLKLHNSSSTTDFPMIKMINVNTEKLIVGHINSKVKTGVIDLSNTKIIAADAGGISDVRSMAKKLCIPNQIVMLNKYHDPKQTNVSEITQVIGEVSGNDCILLEDMADTCKTARNSSLALKNAGAKNVFFVATHALFTGNSIAFLKEAKFSGVWVTNSCYISKNKKDNIDNLEIIESSNFITDIIINLHNGGSVTDITKSANE